MTIEITDLEEMSLAYMPGNAVRVRAKAVGRVTRMLNVATAGNERAFVTLEDLEDLAQGAAFLGTGGGGDPYIGRLMAKHAIREYGMPEIIEVDELHDDATVLPAAMLGAPTVLVEKAASGEDIDHSVNRLAQLIGKQPDAIMPIEIGGINSMIPVVAAARLGLPLVNCDGMGRAFPELQMATFHVYGVPATPAVIVDEHLETVIVETHDGKRAEDLIRAAAIRMGLSVMISCYPMSGRQVKDCGVRGTLTLALGVGRAISQGRNHGEPVESLLAYLRSTEYYNHCKVLFDGKITDLRRETTRGFSMGHCEIAALDGSARTHDCFISERKSGCPCGWENSRHRPGFDLCGGPGDRPSLLRLRP